MTAVHLAPRPDPQLARALAADLDAADFRSDPLRRLWGPEADDALARGLREPILRALGDRRDPRLILSAGIVLLVAGNLVLAWGEGLAALTLGVALWGAHMALTQGIFARMIADAASPERRATSFGAFFFVSGVAALLASLGAGLLWDRDGAAATFNAGAALAAVAGAMLFLLPSAGSSGPAPPRSP